MATRMDLHEILLDELGTDQVYFQPPESVKMLYPCFVYSIENSPTEHADDTNYKVNDRYLVRYITRDPDDELVGALKWIHGFSFERHYVADNLHHYVYVYTFY